MSSDQQDVETLATKAELERWWSYVIVPWWRDLDYLGHVTAASYASIYEEAFGRFMQERWATSEPSYVVAKLSITYVREVRMEHTPLTVKVCVQSSSSSSFSVSMVLVDVHGQVRSTAEARYVRWDGVNRCATPMSADEIAALREFAV